jgi:hypothetical protein
VGSYDYSAQKQQRLKDQQKKGLGSGEHSILGYAVEDVTFSAIPGDEHCEVQR